MVYRFPRQLFRRNVHGGSNHCPAWCLCFCVFRGIQFGKSKVSNFDKRHTLGKIKARWCLSEDQVSRFDVLMNDVMRLGVCQAECCLAKNPQAGLCIEWSALQLFSKILPLNKFHHKVETIVVAAEVIRPNDIRMLQSSNRGAFLFESADHILCGHS